MKSVIVTGANGFIGGYLVEALLSAGWKVIGHDQFPARISHTENYTHEGSDITDADAMRQVFEKHRPQALLHIAALVHKKGNDLSCENFTRINHTASKQLFDLAQEFGVQQVLFASTIEVYGDCQQKVVDEETPTHPMSFYAQSKKAAEEELLAVSNSFARWAIMRFASVYGPTFLLNLKKYIYLPKIPCGYYFLDGGYRLHFCSVLNIVDFVMAFMEGHGQNGLYVLADAKDVSVKELLNYEKSVGRAKWIIHMPYKLCYGMVGFAEKMMRLIGIKEPFVSRQNFQKLFRRRRYDCSKAQGLTPMQHDFQDTIYHIGG